MPVATITCSHSVSYAFEVAAARGAGDGQLPGARARRASALRDRPPVRAVRPPAPPQPPRRLVQRALASARRPCLWPIHHSLCRTATPLHSRARRSLVGQEAAALLATHDPLFAASCSSPNEYDYVTVNLK